MTRITEIAESDTGKRAGSVLNFMDKIIPKQAASGATAWGARGTRAGIQTIASTNRSLRRWAGNQRKMTA